MTNESRVSFVGLFWQKKQGCLLEEIYGHILDKFLVLRTGIIWPFPRDLKHSPAGLEIEKKYDLPNRRSNTI